MWCAATGSFVAGLSLELVHFQTTGLIGDLMTFFLPQTNPSATFSLMSLPIRMPQSTDVYVGSRVISAVIIATSIIGPALFLLAAGLTLVATRPKVQDGPLVRRWTALTDHLYGWAALEVMWICTLASAREMDLIAQWVFNR